MPFVAIEGAIRAASTAGALSSPSSGNCNGKGNQSYCDYDEDDKNICHFF